MLLLYVMVRFVMPTIKELFPWKLKLSDEEFASLWDNAIIVFDTNTLCDFFRSSLNSTKEYIRNLEKIKERIWIPHQVAQEFLKNYKNDVEKEINSFKTAIESINEWEEKQKGLMPLKNKIKGVNRMITSVIDNIFLSVEQTNLQTINESVESVRSKVIDLQQKYVQKDEDVEEILEMTLNLIGEHVGLPYSAEELEKIYKEGDDRYTKKIPPGFEDRKTKQDNSQYGDLIVWKQILDYSRDSQKPIIFVTQEAKIDWWDKSKGRENFEPLEELRREFFEKTKQLFWMYRWDSFLNVAKERKILEISSDSLREATNISDFEKDNFMDKIPNEIKTFNINSYESQIIQTSQEEDSNFRYVKARELNNNRSKFHLIKLIFHTKVLMMQISELKTGILITPDFEMPAIIREKESNLEILEQSVISLTNELIRIHKLSEGLSLKQLDNLQRKYNIINESVEKLKIFIQPFLSAKIANMDEGA
jgi:PIN like domain